MCRKFCLDGCARGFSRCFFSKGRNHFPPHPSETRPNDRNAIDYINCHIDDRHKILYCALDYSHISKHRNLNVSSSLNDVATWSVNRTGFFCSDPKWKIVEGGGIEPFDAGGSSSSSGGGGGDAGGTADLSRRLGGLLFFPMEQMGILRTNCIE